MHPWTGPSWFKVNNFCLISSNKINQLDESTAHRQLKSPRSLTGRSIHLTLVTKWSWSWSWMTYCHPLCAMSIGPLFWDTAISKFDHENPWSRSCVSSKVKVTFDLQNSKVKAMVKVKPIGHIWGLEFMRYVCFSFRGNRTTFGWVQEIPYLTSKIQGQGHAQGQTQWSHLSPRVQSICLLFVSSQSDHFWQGQGHGQVKPDGHIWALEFNRYVCFSFRGNWTIFGWDIANSIFDLEKSRSRSGRKSTKI